MGIITIGLGFILLIIGRSIYPVFTGAVGFVVTAFLLSNVIPYPSGWSPIVASLFAGGVMFALAFMFQRPVAWVAGLGAGAYLVYGLPSALGGAAVRDQYLLMAGVGVGCLVALVVMFDISLVILSSMMASTMIMQFLKIANVPGPGLLLILLFFGLITQYVLMQYVTPVPD